MVERIKSTALTALGFLLLGPLFGTIAYGVFAFSVANEPAEPMAAAFAILWMLPFGYVLGAGPALVTGLIAGAGAPALPAWWWLRALASGLAGGAVAAVWTVLDADPIQMTLAEGVINASLIGAFAGLMSGLILLRAKPKPQARQA